MKRYFTHLLKRRDNMVPFVAVLKEMRIKQYTKNFLVFASALFAGKFLDVHVLLLALGAFIAFSFISSVVYVINDICDIEKDRQHPKKRFRPIASGEISVPLAIVLACALLMLSMWLAYSISVKLVYVLLIYLVMNLAYSFYLKHVVLVDIMIIALGFVLRAFAGAFACGLDMTSWFVLCVFMLSLFLAVAKRRGEMILLEKSPENGRKVLQFYSVELLNQLLVIVTSITIMSYALFALYSHDNIFMLFTLLPVIYGMFRYLYLVYIKGDGEKPEDVVVHDKPILLTCIVYALSIVVARSM